MLTFTNFDQQETQANRILQNRAIFSTISLLSSFSEDLRFKKKKENRYQPLQQTERERSNGLITVFKEPVKHFECLYSIYIVMNSYTRKY